MKLLLCFLLAIFFFQNSNSSACIDAERDALLAFKSKLKDPHNLLLSWKGQDCCSWKGVTCHNPSGHVVKLYLRSPYQQDVYGNNSLNGDIDPSLLSLRNLTHLDLSGNSFAKTEIPSFMGQFENLLYLNLSMTGFVGILPSEIGNLKRLRYLDMSRTNIRGSIPPQLGNISTLSFLSFSNNGLLEIQNIQWISKLNSLEHLDLTSLNLSSHTDWFHVFNKLKYLKVLILSSCDLYKIPSYVASLNFTGLTYLDLSYNQFESPVPIWLGNFTLLSHLDLSNARFQGLSNGILSKSKQRMCQLRYLDLSYSNITGSVTDFVRKFACSWKSMEVLSMENNYLDGNLPTGWLNEMSNLTHLDLRNNKITGVLPTEIVKLSKLSYLDLSNNLLEGILSQNHLENLTQLQMLDLSFNMLKIAIGQHWFPKFQLTELALQSCQVGPIFPTWLKSQMQMYYLNLQNSSISDDLPPWFWIPSYRFVDLSYNNLHGELPHSLQSLHLEVLVLSSNNLGGPIRSLPHNLTILDISHNKFSGTLLWISTQSQLEILSAKNNLFSGEIPSSICDITSLSILDISINNISGRFPNCMSKLKYLTIVDTAFNSISGNIPNLIGSVVYLVSLVLHGNILTGQIPRSLKYCQSLVFLDLGKNRLTGKIPKWIGVSLPSLAYLQLRENNFNGDIPPELSLLIKLQVLDLASNNLVGSIPDCFGNFSAMASMSLPLNLMAVGFGLGLDESHILEYTYSSSLAVIIKGRIIEYNKTLLFVNSLDLSGNNLSGSIPNSIVALQNLQTLNLSRNHLNGKIPEKIGELKSLESLDLSFNELSDVIPQTMSELTFLSDLNLSYNNLSGPIPVGNQLNTLIDSSSYIGNAFLCGGPTNRTCLIDDAKSALVPDGSSDSYAIWLHFCVGVGFAFGLWLVWCVILLNAV